jgi:Gram-negative bacterial TonB protein C-terminal
VRQILDTQKQLALMEFKVRGLVRVGRCGRQCERDRVVRGLPDGLTEQAIAAVRLSKFKPAAKDAKPVEFWIAVEINFNLR